MSTLINDRLIDAANLLAEIADEFLYACLLLMLGETDGYQTFCRELVARPGQPEDDYAAIVMAWVCAVGESDAVEPEQFSAKQFRRRSINGLARWPGVGGLFERTANVHLQSGDQRVVKWTDEMCCCAKQNHFCILISKTSPHFETFSRSKDPINVENSPKIPQCFSFS